MHFNRSHSLLGEDSQRNAVPEASPSPAQRPRGRLIWKRPSEGLKGCLERGRSPLGVDRWTEERTSRAETREQPSHAPEGEQRPARPRRRRGLWGRDRRVSPFLSSGAGRDQWSGGRGSQLQFVPRFIDAQHVDLSQLMGLLPLDPRMRPRRSASARR